MGGGTRRFSIGAVTLSVLAVGLAFVCASYPIRNSDFWRHLAVGRVISQGNYTFGVDPLSYTTDGIYWANHAWLFDLALYQIYGNFGGAAVALLKAGAVAFLAAILLQCRRHGQSMTLPLVGTVLAVIAMSPRFLMQSAFVSIVFLAITIAILTSRSRSRFHWILPVLFAAWVNLDSWFFLGPVVLLFFWIGERLAPRGEELRAISIWLLLAGFAACLLSPHHVHAWVLPPEISPAVLTSEFRDDPRLARYFQPAWRGIVLFRGSTPDLWFTRGRPELTGFAAAGLFIAGGVSFILHRRALRDGRFFVWLTMAGLALWNARLISFFAVAAGPILVLNLQDFMAARAEASTDVVRRGSWLLDALTAGLVHLVLVGLIALAWLGGLQGQNVDARLAAWEVQPDAGLRRGAETRAAWRQKGWLTDDDRVFHASVDAAHYSAWFAPGEKCFVDLRLNHFTKVAGEYEGVCQRLGLKAPTPGESKSQSVVFEKSNFSVIVVGDADIERLRAAVSRIWLQADVVMLDVGGREATFGVPGARRNGVPFEQWKLDFNRAAFFPEKSAPAQPTIAARPPVETTPRWWHLFTKRRPPPASEIDTTALLLQYIDDQKRIHSDAVERSRLALFAAGLVAENTGPERFIEKATMVKFKIDYGRLFFAPLDTAPPGLSYLMIRQARAGVAANPQSALAHLRLGQAYLALIDTTREGVWAARFRPLAQLRHVQTISALERAVALDPDLVAARELLVHVYSDRGMLDCVLHHLNELIRTEQEKSPRGASSTEKLKELRQKRTELEKAVQDRKNELIIGSRGLGSNPLARANMALRLGLARTALEEILLPSNVVLFGRDGARQEMELLLMLGRPERARSEMDDPQFQQNRDRLGWVELPGTGNPNYPNVYKFPAYPWGRFLLEVADGNYQKAMENLNEIADRMHDERLDRERQSQIALTIFAATQIGLSTAPWQRWATRPLFAPDPAVGPALKGMKRTYLQIEADIKCLAGLVAIEAGRMEEALQLLREAAAIGAKSEIGEIGFPSEAICHGYLNQLESARK